MSVFTPEQIARRRTKAFEAEEARHRLYLSAVRTLNAIGDRGKITNFDSERIHSYVIRGLRRLERESPKLLDAYKNLPELEAFVKIIDYDKSTHLKAWKEFGILPKRKPEYDYESLLVALGRRGPYLPEQSDEDDDDDEAFFDAVDDTVDPSEGLFIGWEGELEANNDAFFERYKTDRLEIAYETIEEGGEVRMEVHNESDQIVIVHRGVVDIQLTVIGSESKRPERISAISTPGHLGVILAGTAHRLVNVGDGQAKALVIYAPPK